MTAPRRPFSVNQTNGVRMMKRLYVLFAAVLYLLGPTLPAAASSLPAYYPESFDRWGVVNQVDSDNRTLVVSDIKVPLSLNLKVYTPTTRFGTIQSLQPGMKIGFGTTGSRAVRSGAVSELWVLPNDYTPEYLAH